MKRVNESGVRSQKPEGSGWKTAAVVVAGAAFVLTAGCRREAAPATQSGDPPPVRAEIVEIKTEPFAATVAVTGTLVSTTRVDVKAQTVGRVVKFPKEEGESVAAGEAVVWVDDADYRLAVRQAESSVEVARAALERAQVLENHATTELERARNLATSGGITQKELQAAELAERDARAQVALASAQVDQAIAVLESARKRLRDTVIHAPVAGEIQRKYVNTGAYVEAPTPVFSLVDNSRLDLESQVSSSDLAAVRVGQPVTFTVLSYPGDPFEGRTTEINPAVDPDTRSVKVRIRVNNRSGRLKAGMFAQGAIRTGAERQAIVIPAAAVHRDDRSSKDGWVFVVKEGKAAVRRVRVGLERDSSVEILEGLAPGDMLIAEQSIEVAEGVRVQARK